MKKQQKEIGNDENHQRIEEQTKTKTIGNEANHKRNEEKSKRNMK